MPVSRKALLVLLVLVAESLLSQQLRFRRLTAEDGLSSNFVRSIVRDGHGFMWFGTQDGLNRFDGYDMKIYRQSVRDSFSLSSSDITCLLQVQNVLYVGTRNGLNRLDLLTGKCAVVGGLREARVTALLQYDSVTVLAGTAGGLAKIHHLEDTAQMVPVTGRSPHVLSLAFFGRQVFAGTRGAGLWRLGRDGKLERVRITVSQFAKADTAQLRTITALRAYGGRLYAGTEGAGIIKIDGEMELQNRISFAQLGAGTDIIRDFIIHNSAIHAATPFGLVVSHLISGRVQHYARQQDMQGLNSNPCNVVYADDEGNTWVGTDLGGVNVALHRALRFPLSPYGFERQSENVYAFAPAGRYGYFVGGDRLLRLINSEEGLSVDFSSILAEGTARCILFEPDDAGGVLWIGTWGNGLVRYDVGTRKRTNVIDGRLAGTILSLTEHNGSLIAATAGGGLFRIRWAKTPLVEQFSEHNGLPAASVNCVYPRSDGLFWLGTYDAGLILAALPDTAGPAKVLGRFTAGGKKTDLPSNVVFALNEDLNGNLWVGTSAGLSRLMRDSTFSNFSVGDGLPGNQVYSLLRDSTGGFWMSSNAGIVRFDPGVPREQVVFRTYGQKDGLLNTTYNMGAAMSGTNGMMYFGGPAGFNVFRPTSVRDNLHPPPVYAVRFELGGRPRATDTLIAFKRHLRLDWNGNSFSFGMAALDFSDPHKNIYSYKLEGYDADWSHPSGNRFASYHEVPGGTYTFMVRAANNDGVWNREPWQVTITVVPPFWKSHAFLFLMVMCGFALMYGFSALRTRSIRREKSILEKKVAERTRELEERNREITSSIEYARRIQEAILPPRDQITGRFKRVFIFYRPKDIVSGDFYWFAEKDGVRVFAVVDCTGHGVPGAFMSMIGHNLLDQIVTENGVTDPGEILDHLHRGVLQALRQGSGEVDTNDGMDVSLVAVNVRDGEVRWAGANRPLVVIGQAGEMIVVEGNKEPVGGTQAHPDRRFDTQKIDTGAPAMMYLFTDGYADQFGGDRGKKFMVRRLHDLLRSIHQLSPDEQQAALEREFENWRLQHEQVDDVLIAGIGIGPLPA